MQAVFSSVIVLIFCIHNSGYFYLVLVYGMECIVQLLFLYIFFYFSYKALTRLEASYSSKFAMATIAIIFSIYVIVVTGLSVNGSRFESFSNLCSSIFWYLMRISSIVMVIVLFIIMLYLTIRVLNTLKSQSSYDCIIERRFKKQFKKLWAFIAIYFVSSLILFVYDLSQYYDSDGLCAFELIDNVVLDNIVWTICRVLAYYVRPAICFWAFYRARGSQFSQVDIDTTPSKATIDLLENINFRTSSKEEEPEIVATRQCTSHDASFNHV